MRAPVPFDNLVSLLAKLPGIGRRSAERMALMLAQDQAGLSRQLADALHALDESVGSCSLCGCLTLRTEDPCGMCRDPRRDPQLLCVVETPGDIIKLEQAGVFRGRYHALMGKLSPMRGAGPGQLRIDSLLRRVRDENISEVLIALNMDAESEATADYLHELLHARAVKVTRLAFGIPAGSAIEYSDRLTLLRAIEGRVNMDG